MKVYLQPWWDRQCPWKCLSGTVCCDVEAGCLCLIVLSNELFVINDPVHLWSGGGVLDTVKVKAESLALTYSAVNEVMLKKISLSFSSLSDRVVAGACVCRGGVPANSGISAEACCSRERSRNRLSYHLHSVL